MKICVFFLIQLLPFIVKVGDWALRWTEGNTAVQIFFVMLLFPVIMNAIQYYIIDTFIKKPITPADEILAEEDDQEGTLVDNEEDHRTGLLASLEHDGILDAGDNPRKDPPKKSGPPSHGKEAFGGALTGVAAAAAAHYVSRGHHSSSSSASSNSG